MNRATRYITAAVLLAVLGMSDPLRAEPWIRRREGRFVILADRSVAAGELDRVAGSLSRIQARLKKDLDFSFELPMVVRVYGSTAAYSEATGQVWWHGACTCGGKIHLQPPHVLIERGILEWVTVHEVVHQALRALTSGNLPLWFEEGFAELMAIESVSAMDVEPDPEGMENYSFPDAESLDQALAQTGDMEKAEAAYRTAARLIARIRTRFGYDLMLSYFERIKDGMDHDKAFRRSFEITVEEFWSGSGDWPLTDSPAPAIIFPQE